MLERIITRSVTVIEMNTAGLFAVHTDNFRLGGNVYLIAGIAVLIQDIDPVTSVTLTDFPVLARATVSINQYHTHLLCQRDDVTITDAGIETKNEAGRNYGFVPVVWKYKGEEIDVFIENYANLPAPFRLVFCFKVLTE